MRLLKVIAGIDLTFLVALPFAVAPAWRQAGWTRAQRFRAILVAAGAGHRAREGCPSGLDASNHPALS